MSPSIAALLALSTALVASPLPVRSPMVPGAKRPEEVIVRTTNGRALRGRLMPARDSSPANTSARAVRISCRRGEIEIPAEQVLAVTRVAPLLREYRRLSRRAGKSAQEHFKVGSWCAQQGLENEMKREFDRVLTAQPDQRGIDAVLRRLDLESLVTLAPGGPTQMGRELLRRGARLLKKPTECRLVMLRMEALAPDYYEPILVAGLTSHRAATRIFALQALGHLLPGQHLRDVLIRSLLERDTAVRRMANLVLQSSSDPGLVYPLLRGLNHRNPRVRLHAIEALAALRDPRAVDGLILRVYHSGGSGQRVNISTTRQVSYVQDFDVEVAMASAIADPVINVLQEGQVFDVKLIGTSGTTDYRLERGAALGALRKIAGRDLGRDPRAWSRWWQENRTEILASFYAERGIPEPADNGD